MLKSLLNFIGNNGKLIQDYSQGSFTKSLELEVQEGICYGLVTYWLTANKKNRSFFENEYNYRGLAIKGQKKHQLDPSAMLYQSIEKESKIDDLSANLGKSIQKETAFGNAAQEIANFILKAEANYFRLSIYGKDSGHSIGIIRPWQYFYKSQKTFLFDPNFGEFELYNETGLISFLKGLPNISKTYANMNKGYKILAYD